MRVGCYALQSKDCLREKEREQRTEGGPRLGVALLLEGVEVFLLRALTSSSSPW